MADLMTHLQIDTAGVLLDGQRRLLESVAAGSPLPDILAEIVLFIESHAPEMLGSILLLDDDGVHMRHGAAPNLPPEYTSVIDGTPIGDNVGSCGTAMFTRRPVYVADIASDALWSTFCHSALPHGLRASWSTPILDERGHALGAFAMYYKRPGLPQETHIELIKVAVDLAAIAIVRDRLERTRRDREERLRALAAHIETLREEERTRIARELHDELGQSLTALRLELGNLKAKVAAKGQAEGPSLSSKVQELEGLTETTIALVQRVCFELRPTVLDDFGLAPALEAEVRQFEARTGIHCQLEVSDDALGLTPAGATALYRVCQELLTNVVRHSGASTVTVALRRRDDCVALVVSDNGRGMPAAGWREPAGSLGVLGMRERVAPFGGTVEFSATAGGGTTVTVCVPLGRTPCGS